MLHCFFLTIAMSFVVGVTCYALGYNDGRKKGTLEEDKEKIKRIKMIEKYCNLEEERLS